MSQLMLSIVRFLADHQPGVAAFQFSDAHGQLHTIIDKVPIFKLEPLDRNSAYPTQGHARCEVLDRFQDETGRRLVQITLARPDHIESTKGITVFLVLESQVEG